MAPARKGAGGGGGDGGGVAKKKDKSSAVLDGLVTDLFQRVYKPLDLVDAEKVDHLAAIRAIHRLLVQVQKHERPLSRSRTASDAASRMKVLSNWLAQHGIQTDGFRFEENLPEGSGVIATKEISEGEILATIPTSVMMTTLTAISSKEDVGLLAAHDPWFRAVPSLVLAMHLLFEKFRPTETPSIWRGYIESLPGQRSVHEMNVDGPDQILLPLAFSMETIEMLRGTSALAEYHKMLASIAKQYCHMRIALRQLAPSCPAIGRALSWFTFVEFRWAVSMVMMRQNRVPLGEEYAMALVPLLDMFNHEEGALTTHFDFGTKVMEVTAKRAFLPGSQIYISYGTRPNILYLLYAGFLPSQNFVDRIRLRVDLPSSDPLYTKKLALLKWLEVKPKALLDLFWDGSPSLDLAKWLKVAAMEDDAAVMKTMREVIAERAEATALQLKEKAAMAEGEQLKETEKFAEAALSLAESVKQGSKEGERGEGEEQKEGETLQENGKEGEGEKIVGVGLTTSESKILVTMCKEFLKDIDETWENGETQEEGGGGAPAGLGLGVGSGESEEGIKRALKKERELVLRLRKGERRTLEAAVARWDVGGGQE